MQDTRATRHLAAIISATHDADVPVRTSHWNIVTAAASFEQVPQTLSFNADCTDLTSKGDAAMVLVHWQGPWGWGRVCGCNTAPLNVSLMLALSWLFTSRHASSAVQSLERAARS